MQGRNTAGFPCTASEPVFKKWCEHPTVLACTDLPAFPSIAQNFLCLLVMVHKWYTYMAAILCLGNIQCCNHMLCISPVLFLMYFWIPQICSQ
uniref:Uncharacterized protein n=1 Tax=Anguilla anguilla TaxID=7936 RepID=A0A0E9XHC6_ANGAN